LTDGYRIPLFDANAGDHARSCCFVDVSAGGNITSMKSAADVVVPATPAEKEMIDTIPAAGYTMLNSV
jgi:hypothetical protein